MPEEFDAKLERTCSKLDKTSKKLKKVIDLQDRVGTEDGAETSRSSTDISRSIVLAYLGGEGT